MAILLSASVGRNGINQREDVLKVQRQLNLFMPKLGSAKLEENGTADSRTQAAIVAFQKRFVDHKAQDGRVDPRGKTLRALEGQTSTEPPLTLADGVKGSVTYHDSLGDQFRVASDQAVRLIERAIATAGMKAAVITSTWRTADEQASIMYKNAKADYAAQVKMYGATGDQVLKVYNDNKTEPRADVVQLMVDKIEALKKDSKFVSMHVVTLDYYAKHNTIDIGMGSTQAVAGTSYNDKSVAALTAVFNKLKKNKTLANFVDETKKSNRCWHIEFEPSEQIVQ